MVLRISKTGAVYYDAPFTREELQDQRQSASCLSHSSTIALRRFEPKRHAFIAVAGDVQVGWCTKRNGGWYIEDMNCETIGGPFGSLAAATSAAQQVLLHEAGASNLCW